MPGVSRFSFCREHAVGIIKDTCPQCGKQVIPGSLMTIPGKPLRVCAQCKAFGDALQKRIDDALATVVSILYPVS